MGRPRSRSVQNIITLKREKELLRLQPNCLVSWHACVNLSSFALVPGEQQEQCTYCQTLQVMLGNEMNVLLHVNLILTTISSALSHVSIADNIAHHQEWRVTHRGTSWARTIIMQPGD